MQAKLASLFLGILLLTGCELGTATTPTGGDSATGTSVRSATLPVVATATSTASPAPSPTFTPTPIPISRVFGADNFASFVQVGAYWDVVENQIFEDFGLEAGSNRIDAWAYSPDGRYVAIGGCTTVSTAACYKDPFSTGKAFLYILDSETAEVITSIPHDYAEISSLAFTPDSERLVIAICPQKVTVWDLDLGETERELWRGTDECGSHPKVAVSPDGEQAALVFKSTLLVFDLDTGEELAELAAFRHGSVLPKYSGDGSRLAVFTAKDGKEIAIYDTATFQAISRFKVSEVGVSVQSVDLSRDGQWVVTADNSQEADIMLWDASSGELVATLDEPLFWPDMLSFSPDGRMLLVGGLAIENPDDGDLSVWDMTTRQRIGSILQYVFPTRLQFAADGESFVVSGKSRWSLADAEMMTAQQAAVDMLTALHAGDYEAAAALFEPDEYALEAIRAMGLDPQDLPGTLEGICALGTQPCLAVEDVHTMTRLSTSEFEITVSFTAADGSTYHDPDGYADSYVFVARQPDGSYKVTYLPYYMLNP